MGSSTYSVSDRSFRATSEGYATKSIEQIFTQQRSRKIYDKMDPVGITVREACDSENHPDSVPVQLYLDVTGSMGRIPQMFIQDGLPTLISDIIQAGIPDVALMFGAVGDHECDRYPLQVAQFESGDEELDYWLTHTFIEGGGGGNSGESYALAWYFAGNHTRSDAFDKRGRKGFVFTIGDEPILKNYPARAIKNLMGETAALEQKATAEELLRKAQEQNYVYHIHIAHGYSSRSSYILNPWKELLGENVLVVEDYTEIPKLIAQKVVQVANTEYTTEPTVTKIEDVLPSCKETENIIL